MMCYELPLGVLFLGADVHFFLFFGLTFHFLMSILFPSLLRQALLTAGWSSPVARQAHNLKVAGSSPAPASKKVVFLRLSEVVSDWRTLFLSWQGIEGCGHGKRI